MVTAREARALGVQWVFYPVADVNSNPDNPIINIRSFGENPQEVAKFVTAFIEGARADPKNRVLTTAKHFPGHGDTAVDTHMNLASIPAGTGATAARGTGAVRSGDSRRRGFGDDGAHRCAGARCAGYAGYGVHGRSSPALLREQLGFKGIVAHRRAGDGRDRQRLQRRRSRGAKPWKRAWMCWS